MNVEFIHRSILVYEIGGVFGEVKLTVIQYLVFAFLEVDPQTYTDNRYCDYGSNY